MTEERIYGGAIRAGKTTAFNESLGTCRDCEKKRAEFRSIGGMELCHECAHDNGLLHYHRDMGLKSPDHFLKGRRNAKIVKIHLEAYREANPI